MEGLLRHPRGREQHAAASLIVPALADVKATKGYSFLDADLLPRRLGLQLDSWDSGFLFPDFLL